LKVGRIGGNRAEIDDKGFWLKGLVGFYKPTPDFDFDSFPEFLGQFQWVFDVGFFDVNADEGFREAGFVADEQGFDRVFKSVFFVIEGFEVLEIMLPKLAAVAGVAAVFAETGDENEVKMPPHGFFQLDFGMFRVFLGEFAAAQRDAVVVQHGAGELGVEFDHCAFDVHDGAGGHLNHRTF